MVRQASSFLPRSSHNVGGQVNTFISQETSNVKKALKLDPIIMSSTHVYTAWTFILPFFISVLILMAVFILALFGNVSNLGPLQFFFIYALILSFNYIGGYVYRSFLAKEVDTSYFTYVYVCMYSLIYLPLSIFFSILLGAVGSIFSFAMAMVSQYYTSECLTLGYNFQNGKKMFLFRLLTLIIQFTFIIGVTFYVESSATQKPV